MFILVRPDLRLTRPRAQLAAVGLCAAIAAGAVLRSVWPEDIEYKADEAWTYTQTRVVRDGGPWPRTGMPTSQNVANPVASVWVFIGLSEVFRPESPAELARIGQWMNVLAIAGLVVFARLCVPPGARAVWAGAAALAAVNPLAVVLHRKIWPPSIAPLLMLGVVVGWWHRDRRWGAALWGCLGAAIGQLHLSGLILAAGMAVWAAVFDRRGVRWGAWALGTALAAWPLVLWLPDAIEQAGRHPTGQIRLSNIATLNFYLRWATEPFGLTLTYSLGDDFGDFLRYPLVAGRPTYVVAGLHAAVFALMGSLFVSAARRGWRERGRWREVLSGRGSQTTFALNAVALGYGGLLTLSCLPIHRHYMLVAFPMMYLWVAGLALADRRPLAFGVTRGQALLAALCLVQSAVSACFLDYVHDSRRTIRGDYGTPYAAQIRYGLPPK
ncbi:MAG: rane protein of unknown function [Gemmataceae bacterium]|nr:rane protein of unknown function [Gemmataceae bacterium]